MIDFYDDDLPEVHQPWAESLSQNKDAILMTAKYISIPITAFAANCIFNYWIKKKIGSL